jgi:hypothetical protein
VPDRTLDEIEKDLRACEEYGLHGTIQSAFRYMGDLRVNMLALVQHVQELKGAEGPGGLTPHERTK